MQRIDKRFDEKYQADSSFELLATLPLGIETPFIDPLTSPEFMVGIASEARWGLKPYRNDVGTIGGRALGWPLKPVGD